jgi:hypothetical protein
MATETAPRGSLIRFVLIALIALSGLCMIFAGVVTAAEAWQEHAQEQWPEVTARVDSCRMEQSSTRRREMYSIHCRLSYTVGGKKNVANVYSSSAPSRRVWQYPHDQIAPLEEWVEEHPAGTLIAVRYNPDRPTKVVLVTADMPRGGPRTPNNLKQVGFWAGSFLVLLAIARITRPRPVQKDDPSAKKSRQFN